MPQLFVDVIAGPIGTPYRIPEFVFSCVSVAASLRIILFRKFNSATLQSLVPKTITTPGADLSLIGLPGSSPLFEIQEPISLRVQVPD